MISLDSPRRFPEAEKINVWLWLHSSALRRICKRQAVENRPLSNSFKIFCYNKQKPVNRGISGGKRDLDCSKSPAVAPVYGPFKYGIL